MRFLLAIPLALLAGCTSSTVTDTAKNRAIVSTSAAPICRQGGAIRTAAQMAAVATIRKGYRRFIIADADARDNVRVLTTGPTYATGGAGGFYTLGGSSTIVAGRHNARMNVVMFNPGDRGYGTAIDARQVLGADWQEKVKQGITTCA